MRSWLTMMAAGLLAACAGVDRRPDPARFDLGPVQARLSEAAGVAAVSVSAPSWLAGSAMQYRLAYADPARRREFADSRWVAPPPELIGQALERRLGGRDGLCRLDIELDEFAQVFEAVDRSALVLAGRAALTSGADVVARHAFSITRPTPTADARGGVAAAAEAVAALAEDLGSWRSHTNRCL